MNFDYIILTLSIKVKQLTSLKNEMALFFPFKRKDKF